MLGKPLRRSQSGFSCRESPHLPLHPSQNQTYPTRVPTRAVAWLAAFACMAAGCATQPQPQRASPREPFVVSIPAFPPYEERIQLPAAPLPATEPSAAAVTQVDLTLATQEKVDTPPELHVPVPWEMLFPSNASGYANGVVKLRLQIAPDGAVTAMTVEEASWPGLGELVQHRLQRCSFSPAKVAGEPVSCVVLCQVRFSALPATASILNPRGA